jgi:hypothetical protein
MDVWPRLAGRIEGLGRLDFKPWPPCRMFTCGARFSSSPYNTNGGNVYVRLEAHF